MSSVDPRTAAARSGSALRLMTVHAHPDDSGTLTFLTRFPKPGSYRGWLQYQTGGQVQTLTLTLHAD